MKGGREPAHHVSSNSPTNYTMEATEKMMNAESVRRKAGRPKAVPEILIPSVLSLYRQGLGYRSIARELRQEGISVDWSTIRRVIKARKQSSIGVHNI